MKNSTREPRQRKRRAQWSCTGKHGSDHAKAIVTLRSLCSYQQRQPLKMLSHEDEMLRCCLITWNIYGLKNNRLKQATCEKGIETIPGDEC